MEIVIFRRSTTGTDNAALQPGQQAQEETGLKASGWVLIALPLALAVLPAAINNYYAFELEARKRDNAIAIECAKAAVSATPDNATRAPDLNFCRPFIRGGPGT